MTAIKQRLEAFMQANNLNTPQLAKWAGLPVASIKSILQGRSKNPRGTTLTALSKAFNCSITDLLGDGVLSTPANFPLPVINGEKLELFKAALGTVDEIAQEKGLDFSSRDDLREHYATALYQYAIEHAEENATPPKIDRVFARWVMRQS